MAFDVSADAYGKFMGRYSEPLAVLFADWIGVAPGQHVLDVGCGPGALTAVLAERLGPDSVAAVDPSPSFVAAARARFPGLEVHEGVAERLPHADDTFDVAAAQLVVHFMTDPVAGLREMARVTRPGGVVAASVWDHAGAGGPLTPFWRAVRRGAPHNRGEADLPGAREGHLAQLMREAGLRDVEDASLTVRVHYASFDEWWEPYTFGVGPAGDYIRGLDDAKRAEVRARCEEALGPGPFDVPASAWCARGHA
ncbi:MAG: class I SAM-dependent methyltransferase [Nocardioides sp.]